MRIPALPTSHLSYCSNIHPGESWAEIRDKLQKYLPLVKNQVCPEKKFGVGLRLSAQAASTLYENRNELRALKDWLNAHDLYVYTLNGFPFGTFHERVIKERVYLPDWCSEERSKYTRQLASVLAELLPEGEYGSISTVPVGFSAHFSEENNIAAAVERLLDYVVFACRLEGVTGRRIALALEPEPGCYLEDTAGTLAFFEDYLYSESALGKLAGKGLDTESCRLETLQRYLGVCIDTCHAAVMFENPLQMARALRTAGISIPKLQLTAALKMNLQSEPNLDYLRAYAENNYLHQTCVKLKNGDKHFFLDLPETLSALGKASTREREEFVELRSHFHVPVFVEQLDGLQTTRAELEEFIAALPRENFSQHLEVETYTFDVLPENQVNDSVDVSISRELDWVLEKLA